MLSIFKKKQEEDELPQYDIDPNRTSLFVHPEHHGFIVVNWDRNAWTGSAYKNGESFRTSLRELLAQDWIDQTTEYRKKMAI